MYNNIKYILIQYIIVRIIEILLILRNKNAKIFLRQISGEVPDALKLLFGRVTSRWKTSIYADLIWVPNIYLRSNLILKLTSSYGIWEIPSLEMLSNPIKP